MDEVVPAFMDPKLEELYHALDLGPRGYRRDQRPVMTDQPLRSHLQVFNELGLADETSLLSVLIIDAIRSGRYLVGPDRAAIRLSPQAKAVFGYSYDVTLDTLRALIRNHLVPHVDLSLGQQQILENPTILREERRERYLVMETASAYMP